LTVPTTALITGITGQDGGYLAERLVAEGLDVHGVTRHGEQLPPHLLALGDAVVIHHAELTDAAWAAGLLLQVQPDEVYNLAGVSSVAQSWSEPVLTAQVNGVAVLALLEAANAARRRGRDLRLVQASSAEIFAGAGVSPQDEDSRVAPLSPYGAAKALAHHGVQLYRSQGLHATNAILYNHESPRRPSSFVTRKITATVAAIASGRAGELVLGNLDARRDWGWAPDYVDALVRMARADEPGDFVVATGTAHSVADFVAAAFRRVGIVNWEGLVRSDPAFVRPADAVELVGDAARARDLLGWSPSVAFEELVAAMVDAETA
jgi:GDPmannose 4,6-dehydratase